MFEVPISAGIFGIVIISLAVITNRVAHNKMPGFHVNSRPYMKFLQILSYIVVFFGILTLFIISL